MRSAFLLLALSLMLVGLTGAQEIAGPVLPQQHDGRLVHPDSPLDTVMSSEHNSIAWLKAYPIDLTGMPGWMIFKASGFAKDGDMTSKVRLRTERMTVVQPMNMTLLDSGLLTTFSHF